MPLAMVAGMRAAAWRAACAHAHNPAQLVLSARAVRRRRAAFVLQTSGKCKNPVTTLGECTVSISTRIFGNHHAGRG